MYLEWQEEAVLEREGERDHTLPDKTLFPTELLPEELPVRRRYLGVAHGVLDEVDAPTILEEQVGEVSVVAVRALDAAVALAQVVLGDRALSLELAIMNLDLEQVTQQRLADTVGHALQVLLQPGRLP